MKPWTRVLLPFIFAGALHVSCNSSEDYPQPLPPAEDGGAAITPKPRGYRCPPGPCDRVTIDAINSARSSLKIEIYAFTLDSIADAIVAKRREGKDVKVVMDKKMRDGNAAAGAIYTRFKNEGIEVRVLELPGNGSLHNKIIIIDDKTVLSGSYNFTRTATNLNKENILIVTEEEVAATYLAGFADIFDAARQD